jgi:hypothetical protein
MGTSPEVPCLFLLSAPPKVPRLVGIPSAAPKSGDDVDGTSPGTQPEQALLEAEEQHSPMNRASVSNSGLPGSYRPRHLVSSSGGDRARRP